MVMEICRSNETPGREGPQRGELPSVAAVILTACASSECDRGAKSGKSVMQSLGGEQRNQQTFGRDVGVLEHTAGFSLWTFPEQLECMGKKAKKYSENTFQKQNGVFQQSCEASKFGDHWEKMPCNHLRLLVQNLSDPKADVCS